MKEVCLDANIYIGLYSPDEVYQKDVYAPIEEHYFTENTVHWAPSHLVSEVMHALERKCKLNRISQRELTDLQNSFLELPLVFLYDVKYHRLVLDVQKRTGLCHFDSGYLACAIHKNILLITRDQEIAKKGQKIYKNIQLV